MEFRVSSDLHSLPTTLSSASEDTPTLSNEDWQEPKEPSLSPWLRAGMINSPSLPPCPDGSTTVLRSSMTLQMPSSCSLRTVYPRSSFRMTTLTGDSFRRPANSSPPNQESSHGTLLSRALDNRSILGWDRASRRR